MLLVARPALLSVKNRWKSTASVSRSRDLILLIFSVIIAVALYQGSVTTLEVIQKHADTAYLPPGLPLGLLFMFLFCMLLISNGVTALGSFYTAHDLPLLMSAPLSGWRFFSGRCACVLGSSSWMVLVFGVPVILAFGAAYHAAPIFYLWALAVMPPLFVIPSMLGTTVVFVLVRILPSGRTKEMLSVLLLAAVWLMYYSAQALFSSPVNQGAQDIVRVISLLSAPSTDWAPSYWGGRALGMILEGQNASETWPYLLALYSAAAGCISVAFLVFSLLHFGGFSATKVLRTGATSSFRQRNKWIHWVIPRVNRYYWAMIGKEYRVFFRDMTQAVQLLVLLGLCMIYLYNFRVLRTVQGLPEATRLWWQAALVLANIGMGGFVIAAVSTRLVFPSLSLEGKSYWILQAASVSLGGILRAKFWAWLFPVATISCIILTSGALAIDAEPHIVAIHAVVSWVLCYGIVGLAVGMGALFANFTWEHSTQLAASVGSIVFMLASSVLIMLNLIPAGMLVFLRTMKTLGSNFTPFEWYLCVLSCSALLVYINFAVTRWALALGERALEERAGR